MGDDGAESEPEITSLSPEGSGGESEELRVSQRRRRVGRGFPSLVCFCVSQLLLSGSVLAAVEAIWPQLWEDLSP